MIRLERIFLFLVLTGFVARGGLSTETDRFAPNKDDGLVSTETEEGRGLRYRTRHGFLDGRFPIQRYRNNPYNGHYRLGKGGSSSKKGKSKSKGGKGGGYNPYDDDIYGDDFLDDDGGANGLNGYDISFCLPIPHSSSTSSSSDSWDFHKVRNRQLRGYNRARRSKSKGQWGGRGKGKGKGKGSGYRGYGPQDYRYYKNGFGYGFEYGPDGLLRPRCPPGYVYFDQLPDADHPNRPSRVDEDGPDGPSFPTQEPISAEPTEPGQVTLSPGGPDGPGGPDTPATPGPETPAPETPATPGPGPGPGPGPAPETPAPEPPAPETPAPETPAPAPETPAPETPAPETPAPGPDTATTAPTAAAAGDALRVVVEDSFLEYGFFAGTSVREPTQEELDGLIVQTNMFFTNVFMDRYGEDFSSFSAEDSVVTFNGPEAEYPVTVDFTAAAMFAEGATPPSRDEIFSTMQNSDLNTYIQEFVWNSVPVMESIFYDVQRVRYDARITNVIGKSP